MAETPAAKAPVGDRNLAKIQPKPGRAACGTCHVRKVKCDASTVGFPCTNCRQSNRPDCRAHLKRKRTSKRSFGVTPPENVQPSGAYLSPEIKSPVNIRIQPQEPIVDERHEATRLDPRLQDAPLRTSASTDEPTLEDSLGDIQRHLVEFIDQKDMSGRIIDKAARVTYVGTDVSNINFLVRQKGGHDNSRFHYATDKIDRRFTVFEPNRLPVEAFELPDRPIVDELLQAYFTHINPGFPVIGEDRFMSQYMARDPTNPPSLLLLQAILLVGAHVCRTGTERESLKATFFRRAKTLFEARYERNRDVVVQAALLMTWHCDGQEDVAANAYYWIGIAATIAKGLGMHRNTTPSTQVLHTQRMWRRCFWLLFRCDVLMALQYGRPQAINLEDCDVPMLSPADFTECGASPQVDYVIQFAELCIIASGILRHCFGPRVKPDQRKQAVERADQALAKWSLCLPEHLRLRPTVTLSQWPAILQLVYHHILILLHRPRPQKYLTPEELGPNDLDICSVAAGHISAIYEGLRERHAMRCLWVAGVNPLFTAMIQLNVELRFSNPVLSIETLRKFDSSLYSLRELASCWPNVAGILHFFETSERLQRSNLRALHGPAMSPSAARMGDKNDSGVSSAEEHQGQWDSQLRDAMAAPAPDPMMGSNPVGFEELHDWRQLFPFAEVGLEDTTQPGGLFESGEDWQQLYWQEPGFPGFPSS